MNVRQKHAHSWVEAYIGQDADERPDLDHARPDAGQRPRRIGRAGRRLRRRLPPVTDWSATSGSSTSSATTQPAEPAALHADQAHGRRSAAGIRHDLGAGPGQGLPSLFNFQSLGSFISIRGFFVSFLVLSLVAAPGQARCIWLGKRLLRWWRGPADDSAGLTAGILFYRRLAQLLAEFDLERTPAETQHEFARRASRFLTGQGTQTELVADVPRRSSTPSTASGSGTATSIPSRLEELEAQPRRAAESPERDHFLSGPVDRRGRTDRAGVQAEFRRRRESRPACLSKESQACVSDSSDSRAAARARCSSS